MTGARTPTLFWEDFPPDLVREFGSRTVTREEVLSFAAAYDPQPFHLDDEAAAAHPMFGQLAASGWHTGAMAMRMMCDGYPLDSASLGSPGLDKLQWVKPVYPGDVLHMRLTVLEARPMKSRPHIGLTKTRWETFARRPDGAEDLVLVTEGWNMFRRREVPEPANGAP